MPLERKPRKSQSTMKMPDMAKVMLRSALPPRKRGSMPVVSADGDGANSGNQPEPVGEENENENGEKKPEGFLDQFGAEDAFEKIVEAFDEEFPKVLRALGDELHIAGGDLGADRRGPGPDPPGDQHGIGDGKRTDGANALWAPWAAFPPRQPLLGRRRRGGGFSRPAGQRPAPPADLASNGPAKELF